jgi:hypothetical protein
VSKDHYIAVTYHWLDAHWTLRAQVLDLIEFEGPACGAVISTVIEERFDARFPDGVTMASFTSDRGSNVKVARATLTPDDSEDCIPHLLKSALDDVTIAAASLPASEFFCTTARRELSSLQALMTLFRSSASRRDELRRKSPADVQHLAPVISSDTRWEGRYRVLKRALKLRRGFSAVLDRAEDRASVIETTGGAGDMFTSDFWTRIKHLKQLYKIFHVMSKKSQAVGQVTKSRVLKWIQDTRDALLSLRFQVPESETARLCFLHSFDHRFLPLTTSVNNTTKAAILDPCNNGSSLISNELRQNCWEVICEEALLRLPEEARADYTASVAAAASFARKKIAQARGEDMDVVEFWKSLPVGVVGTLISAVKTILAIPAGAAEPERVFSHTTWLVTKLANRLAPFTVEDIVVIRKALQNGFIHFEELLSWIQAQREVSE